VTGPSSADWIDRLQHWAENEENIRLAMLVGSQARSDTPADPLSDIDLALFAREPDQILREEGWVARLGPFWTSHLEPNGLGIGDERRVLFADGQDVDFAVFPLRILEAMVSDPRAATVLRKGFRPLVNKDSIRLSVPTGDRRTSSPSALEFSNLANDFWFHLVWTAKKLRRGELMTALECTNGYLRALLVEAARWHARARGPSGQDLWHAGRFFEKWADPRVVHDFPATVAQYEVRSVARALRADRELFSWVAQEVRQSLSFPAPIRDEASLSKYLDRLLEDRPL
jgi:aminoglycoside 6-adenylyltransferase